MSTPPQEWLDALHAYHIALRDREEAEAADSEMSQRHAREEEASNQRCLHAERLLKDARAALDEALRK